MTQSSSSRSRRIVVGVDGSPSSMSALKWAISEAELHGDMVEAVAVWEYHRDQLRACSSGSWKATRRGVLVAESAEADLLVVGSRGHGTFADALLGSVSQHCAHHSKCPLVIMRGSLLCPKVPTAGRRETV